MSATDPDPAHLPSDPAAEDLLLDEEERDLVASELDAIIPGLRGQRRDRYEALAGAVVEGRVPPDLQPQLQSVLGLALQTSRARQLYTAGGERVLTAVYRRTPEGRELSRHLEAVNRALKALEGHTLRGTRVRMRTLGHFTVTIETDGPRVTLAVRPDNVNVEKVAMS